MEAVSILKRNPNYKAMVVLEKEILFNQKKIKRRQHTVDQYPNLKGIDRLMKEIKALKEENAQLFKSLKKLE